MSSNHFILCRHLLLLSSIFPSLFTSRPGPNIPGFYAILIFIVWASTFTTKHIQSWASFLLWPSLHGSQPCRGKGAWATQWSYEPCLAGPPKTDGSERRVLTKHGALEEGMANHPSVLASRIPWTDRKGKRLVVINPVNKHTEKASSIK